MALNNIIAPRQAVQNSRGQPVAGGQVFLYEPGTTTFITAYSSSDLVTPLTQPIRLSASGRANIWITRDCDMVITDRLGNVVLTEDNANPDALGGETTGGLVPNGSFEIVTTPPVPDSWVAVDEAGSNNAADSSQSTDGANSYRFTSTGSGGGSLTTLDFFPVNDVDPLRVNFDLFSTVAAVRNIVRVEWYDITFVPISNTDVYDSTSNPLSWTEFNLQAIPPALARFAKLRLIGIDPTVAIAGVTYYDRISVFYPTVVSGVFDNITIQNNEIISTNLNGEIALRPNGNGVLEIDYNGNDLVSTADGTLTIRSPGNGNPATPDAIAIEFRFQSQDANDYGSINFGSGDPGDMQVQNEAVDAALVLNLNDSVAAGQVDAIIMGGGRVSLQDYQSDEARLWVTNVTDDDVHIRIAGQLNNTVDPNGLQDAGIYFVNQSEALAALVGFDEGGDDVLQLSNYVADGPLDLQVRLTGPNFRTGIRIDPTVGDGVLLYYPNTDVQRFATQAGGIAAIRSDGNTDTETRRLNLEHQDGTNRGFIGFNASNDLDINNLVDSVRLFDANVEMARTITAATGGMEVNNTLTGAGFERVLTESDIGVGIEGVVKVLGQTITGSTPTTLTSFSITINGSGNDDYYTFRVYVPFRPNTASYGNLQWQWLETGTGPNFTTNQTCYLWDVGAGTFEDVTLDDGLLSGGQLTPGGAGNTHHFIIEGWIRFNTTIGNSKTLELQMARTGATGDTTVLGGAKMEAYLVDSF